MARFTHPLEHVRVAAPCAVDWARMRGNERVRFCAQCSMNVYNLSALTRREAERLITSTNGRLCVRFYRRADGTILTANCPVGLRALKRRVSRLASGIITAVLSFCAGLGLYSMVGVTDEPIPPMMSTMPQEEPVEESPFNGPVAGEIIMGAREVWSNGQATVPLEMGKVALSRGATVVVQPQRRPWRGR